MNTKKIVYLSLIIPFFLAFYSFVKSQSLGVYIGCVLYPALYITIFYIPIIFSFCSIKKISKLLMLIFSQIGLSLAYSSKSFIGNSIGNGDYFLSAFTPIADLFDFFDFFSLVTIPVLFGFLIGKLLDREFPDFYHIEKDFRSNLIGSRKNIQIRENYKVNLSEMNEDFHLYCLNCYNEILKTDKICKYCGGKL